MKINFKFIILLLLFIIIFLNAEINDFVTPTYNSILKNENLNDVVEILRDKDNIIHIIAKNEEDLYFTQGYIHAQERTWSLELYNRALNGKLAEISLLGEGVLEIDIFSKTFGFKEIGIKNWNKILLENPIEANLIKRYVKGINSYAEKYSTQIRTIPEFYALGLIEFTLWTESDVAALLLYTAWDFSAWDMSLELLMSLKIFSGEHTLERSNIQYPNIYVNPTYTLKEAGINKTISEIEYIKTLQEDEFCAFNPYNSINGEKKIFSKNMKDIKLNKNQIKVISEKIKGKDIKNKNNVYLKPLTELRNFSKKRGSNSWVVSGKHCKNNIPILSNDPHASPDAPNFVIISHLKIPSKKFYSFGGTVPGLPGFIFGNNNIYSWGITNSLADVIDVKLMIEPVVGGEDYYFDNEIKKYTYVTKNINIGTTSTYQLIVKKSIHGVVINKIIGLDESIVTLCIEWYPLKENIIDKSLVGNFNLHRQNSLNTFKNNLKNIVTPVLNIMYADEINIAHFTVGKVPIRNIGNPGKHISYGYTSGCSNTENIPFDKMPFLLNPEKGYIANANNGIMPVGWNYDLGHHIIIYGYRYMKIKKVLENFINKNKKISLKDMIELQSNVESELFLDFKKYLINIKNFIQNEDILFWLNKVINWNGKAEKGSKETTIFEKWRKSLYFFISDPDDLYLENYVGRKLYIYNALNNNDQACIDKGKSCIELAAEIFTNVIESFYNTTMEKYIIPEWGKDVHYVNFNSMIFSGDPTMNEYTSRVYYSPGGSGTVNVGGVRNLYLNQRSLAVYRQVVQINNGDKNYFNVPMGQSGNFLSPFYDNFSKDWINTNYNRIEMFKMKPAYKSILKP